MVFISHAEFVGRDPCKIPLGASGVPWVIMLSCDALRSSETITHEGICVLLLFYSFTSFALVLGSEGLLLCAKLLLWLLYVFPNLSFNFFPLADLSDFL